MKKTLTLLFALANLSLFAQWVSKAAIPAASVQHGAVYHPNGKIYLICGYDGTNLEVNTMYIYDVASDSWSAGPAAPMSTRGVSYCLGSDNNIYVSGGYPSGGTLARFNPTTFAWTTLAACPTGNWEASMVSVNNKIYYFGGETQYSSVSIYDIATDTWSTGASMPVGLAQHKAVADRNGNIYVFGGRTQAGTLSNAVQKYDPIANSWTSVGTMPAGKNSFGACLGADDRIYLVCGKDNYGNNQGPFFSTVDVYNPCNNTWSTGTAHPVAHAENAAVATPNGIFSLGGTSGTGLTQNYYLPTPPVVLTGASQTSVCADDADVVLTATPNGGTWSGPGVTGSNFDPSVGAGTYTLTYAYTYAVGCADTGTIAITVNACTGFNENALANGANVYPNPNNGTFTLAINANVGDVLVEIMDMQGRVVFRSNENNVQSGFNKQISLENQAAGVYMVRLTSEKEQHLMKVSVEK